MLMPHNDWWVDVIITTQDESPQSCVNTRINLAIWLATKQERDFPRWSCKKKFAFWHYDNYINSLLTKFVRSRWLETGLAFFAIWLTSTLSRFIKTQKRTLGRVQPSEPHACLIIVRIAKCLPTKKKRISEFFLSWWRN